MSSYESRLERLEQRIAPPVANSLIVYLYDGDTRPAEWMEVQGQRFDRGTDENVSDFQRRAKQSAGVPDHQPLMVIRYVGQNSGNAAKAIGAVAAVELGTIDARASSA